MDHDELISILQGLADELDGDRREALQQAIAICRRKDPSKLVDALAEFDYKYSHWRRKDPAWADAPEVVRGHCYKIAVRLVRFLMLWGRNPEHPIARHAWTIRAQEREEADEQSSDSTGAVPEGGDDAAVE